MKVSISHMSRVRGRVGGVIVRSEVVSRVMELMVIVFSSTWDCIPEFSTYSENGMSLPTIPMSTGEAPPSSGNSISL